MPRGTSFAAVVTAILCAGGVHATTRDPAARGLDIFLHAPKALPSGGLWPVQVRVFGFPTVSTLSPLAGATVEATWIPNPWATR